MAEVTTNEPATGHEEVRIETSETATGQDRAKVTYPLSSLEDVLDAVEQAFAALDEVNCIHLDGEDYTAEELKYRAIYDPVSGIHSRLEELMIELEGIINPDPGPGQRGTPPGRG